MPITGTRACCAAARPDKNVAAPAFGMVCKEHKDVPKRDVKRYRAERRGDFSHGEAGLR